MPRTWTATTGRSRARGLLVACGIITVLALVVLGRLAVFMINPSRTDLSSMPGSTWETQHSCFSAYYVAGRAVSKTPNVYADTLYSFASDPSAPRVPRKLGSFNVDVYEYPPPFLLLPRAIGLLTSEFIPTRALWFGLTVALMLLAFVFISRALGPTAGMRALAMSPLIWLSWPTLSTLQKGNVQGIVIAGSMLAMLLIEKRRRAAGGALLAFLTLGKLYPGVLVVYLLARREWRAVAWTAAASAAIVAVSLIDTGWRPYAAFLDHLPGLMSGEAFPAFRRPAAVAINYSIPGLIFKLKLFGVPGMTFGSAKVVGWLYTLVLLMATVWAARRSWRDEDKPLVWLSILTLATLRSPFLPEAYAGVPGLWLLTLIAARGSGSARSLAGLLAGWIVFNLYWPTDWAMDPRLLAILTLIPQGLTLALPAYVLFERSKEGEPSVTPASPPGQGRAGPATRSTPALRA